MIKSIFTHWTKSTAYGIALVCLIILLILYYCYSNSHMIEVDNARNSESEIVICKNIPPNKIRDSVGGILEEWEVFERHGVSMEIARKFSNSVNTATKTPADTIPATGYIDLVLLFSNGKAECAVARLEYKPYCRISRVIVDKNGSILIDIANDDNFVFVNNVELWNCHRLFHD